MPPGTMVGRERQDRGQCHLDGWMDDDAMEVFAVGDGEPRNNKVVGQQKSRQISNGESIIVCGGANLNLWNLPRVESEEEKKKEPGERRERIVVAWRLGSPRCGSPSPVPFLFRRRRLRHRRRRRRHSRHRRHRRGRRHRPHFPHSNFFFLSCSCSECLTAKWSRGAITTSPPGSKKKKRDFSLCCDASKVTP